MTPRFQPRPYYAFQLLITVDCLQLAVAVICKMLINLYSDGTNPRNGDDSTENLSVRTVTAKDEARVGFYLRFKSS